MIFFASFDVKGVNTGPYKKAPEGANYESYHNAQLDHVHSLRTMPNSIYQNNDTLKYLKFQKLIEQTS